jgi:hypothetical protein
MIRPAGDAAADFQRWPRRAARDRGLEATSRIRCSTRSESGLSTAR